METPPALNRQNVKAFTQMWVSWNQSSNSIPPSSQLPCVPCTSFSVAVLTAQGFRGSYPFFPTALETSLEQAESGVTDPSPGTKAGRDKGHRSPGLPVSSGHVIARSRLKCTQPLSLALHTGEQELTLLPWLLQGRVRCPL